MIRFRFLSMIALVLVCVTTMAQQVEQIAFEEKNFDFGVIKEEDGPVIHEFKFTNNSDQPVTITNVKASCGCTTPAWSREPVAPGETGFIQAKYNPRNRPGKFNKSLTISLKNRPQERVYIRGEVTPRERSPEEMYPAEFGALRMKYKTVNMGKVYINRPLTGRGFEIYNQSDSLVIINPEVDKPDHITIVFDTLVLEPKAKTNMTVTYDGAMRADYGFMNDSFRFFTNEKADSVKDVTVYATLLEYFPRTNEALDNAPKLQIVESMIDLGRVKNSSETIETITLTNTGQSTLSIRKFEPNCTCLKVNSEAFDLDPGKSAEIEMIFKAEGRRGNQQKSITVYSNDPMGSTQRITLKAYIED